MTYRRILREGLSLVFLDPEYALAGLIFNYMWIDICLCTMRLVLCPDLYLPL